MGEIPISRTDHESSRKEVLSTRKVRQPAPRKCKKHGDCCFFQGVLTLPLDENGVRV
jgi:hypothetical protein